VAREGALGVTREEEVATAAAAAASVIEGAALSPTARMVGEIGGTIAWLTTSTLCPEKLDSTPPCEKARPRSCCRVTI